MRSRTKRFLILGICGMALLGYTVLCRDSLPVKAEGILSGLGSVMFAVGFARFFFGRFEEKNPKQMKQYEIEAGDERNRTIRLQAQAVSGIVLQWGVIVIAWATLLFDGPLWIVLLGVGIFFGKTVFELVLMEYYQRRM